MEFLTGFESTHIFGSSKDVLDTTGHTDVFHADLRAVAALGIKTLRYSIPWHKIERDQGAYDWDWMDMAMDSLRHHGLEIIADPLHHTSFPEWLALGFADPRFVWSYVDFVLAFARRYPQVTRFTHINEPLVTSWFCGHEGVWHPKLTGDRPFVGMILNCAEAICRIDRALRADRDDIVFVHVESCEWHFDLWNKRWVRLLNARLNETQLLTDPFFATIPQQTSAVISAEADLTTPGNMAQATAGPDATALPQGPGGPVTMPTAPMVAPPSPPTPAASASNTSKAKAWEAYVQRVLTFT